jgi:hypothetical protein
VPVVRITPGAPKKVLTRPRVRMTPPRLSLRGAGGSSSSRERLVDGTWIRRSERQPAQNASAASFGASSARRSGSLARNDIPYGAGTIAVGSISNGCPPLIWVICVTCGAFSFVPSPRPTSV